MTEALAGEFDEQAARLFIHFDVAEHHLNLDTFIQTADSARKVVAALDKNFFQGSLEYEFIVLPPDDGSFLSKLGIWIGGGVGAVIAFVNSDIGSAYVEGLTGKPPTEWAKEIGQGHRVILDNVWMEDEAIKQNDPAIRDRVSVEDSADGRDAACQQGAKLVIALTKGILELETDSLNMIGMDVGDLSDALDARAEFYQACINDREVRRIGFTPNDDFPIPRNSFPERAVKPARKEKKEDEPEWVVTIEGIYVTSPNWDQEDQKTRQWKGKDAVRRDCYFVIEDQEFWFRVQRKRLHVDVLDSLKVQWAYQIVGNKPQKRRVLRVLEFNGDKLAEPLPDDAINAILGSHSSVEESREGPSLFDFM